MKRTLALALGSLVFALPTAAFAADGSNAQLLSLYTQLVNVLEKELLALSPSPTISIEPASGPAPFTTIFTLSNKTGTEAIDFGDGHSTGSNGCKLNSLGACDLPDQLVHTYIFPANYLVTLYRHIGTDIVVAETKTVLVGPALTSDAASTTAQ